MKTEQLSLRANILWNSFGSLVNLGCQWLISILIVRMGTGYEAAGIFSLAMSVYNIFAPLGQYRMYTYQVTDVNGENTTGEYLSFRLITSSAALVLCALYSIVTCDLSALPAIILFALYRTLVLIIDVFHAVDQRCHRMDYIGKSLAMQGVASLISFVLLFGLTGSLEAALIAMIASVFMVGLFYDWPLTRQFGEVSIGISFKKTRHLLIYCLPIVLAAVAASAAPSIPRQYLSSVYGEGMLGIYAAAAAPVALIQTGASYIYNPLLGYFSERFVARNKTGFVGLFVRATIGIIVLGLIFSLGVLLFGEPVLIFVYGAKMEGYGYLLLPLVLLALITGYMWFINDLLMAIRNFRGSFLGSAVALLASLVCLPLITEFGMQGVTYVCMISCVSGVFVMTCALAIQMHGHWGPQCIEE